MIQESYPSWPRPGTFREFDASTPFDAGPDDVLRRMHHLSRRSIWAVVRDWWRAYSDADLLSYDAKVRAMSHTAPQDLTEAEMRANAARRKRWLRL